MRGKIPAGISFIAAEKKKKTALFALGGRGEAGVSFSTSVYFLSSFWLLAITPC